MHVAGGFVERAMLATRLATSAFGAAKLPDDVADLVAELWWIACRAGRTADDASAGFRRCRTLIRRGAAFTRHVESRLAEHKRSGDQRTVAELDAQLQRYHGAHAVTLAGQSQQAATEVSTIVPLARREDEIIRELVVQLDGTPEASELRAALPTRV